MMFLAIAEVKGRDLAENQKCNFGMPHPEGYRKALRLARQAEKFHRPVICLVDNCNRYALKIGYTAHNSTVVAKKSVSVHLKEIVEYKRDIVLGSRSALVSDYIKSLTSCQLTHLRTPPLLAYEV